MAGNQLLMYVMANNQSLWVWQNATLFQDDRKLVTFELTEN